MRRGERQLAPTAVEIRGGSRARGFGFIGKLRDTRRFPTRQVMGPRREIGLADGFQALHLTSIGPGDEVGRTKPRFSTVGMNKWRRILKESRAASGSPNSSTARSPDLDGSGCAPRTYQRRSNGVFPPIGTETATRHR